MWWFWLYRPAAPAARAQSVQVVNAAHAMAARGHRVELCVEGDRPAAEILAYYGLPMVPELRLHVLPRGTWGSLRYRGLFAAWVARSGGRGIALARRKRHAAWAARWFSGRFRLILEVHEVDSEQARDRGDDPRRWRALEADLLARASGVVANAEGTLDLLRSVHSMVPPAIVAHNGARPWTPTGEEGHGIGIVGSVRPYKDPHTVAAAARLLDRPITWVGADQPLEAPVRAEPPVPYRDVPARLARFRTLLLPLSPGLFGERLTSPLKLWDALQSGVPLVAADTEAVRLAAGGAYVPYRPGDPADLARALAAAERDEALRERVLAVARARARTWAGRAEEIEAFVRGLGA